jgi:transposase
MGHRVTRAATQLPKEAVSARMQKEHRPWRRKPWEILSHAWTAPRKAEEMARTVGMSPTTVHREIATSNRGGVAALETPGNGGRRHQYLTLEQERAFLQPFVARAAQGERATADEIHHAFEQRVGHTVDDSPISRVLNRQGWRKPGAGVKATSILPQPLRAPVLKRTRFPCTRTGNSRVLRRGPVNGRCDASPAI